MKDAGIDAKFPESFDFTFPVADYEKNLEMTIEVVNLRDNGSRKAVIGRTSKTISEIIGSLDKSVPITLELLHGETGKEQKKGFIQFNGILSVFEEKKVEDKKEDGKSPRSKKLEFPNKNATLILTVTAMEAHDLVNTGSSTDKQDPCVAVKVGKRVLETQRQKDAGTEAKFPECFHFSMSCADFENSTPMGIEVFNVGLMGRKTKIGSGSGQLNQLFSEINQPQKARIELTYVEGKQSILKGYVDLVGILSYEDAKLNEASAPRKLLSLVKEDQDCTLMLALANLQAHELKDKGKFYDKQDPCIEIIVNGHMQETER
jgi:hypothetical protein